MIGMWLIRWGWFSSFFFQLKIIQLSTITRNIIGAFSYCEKCSDVIVNKWLNRWESKRLELKFTPFKVSRLTLVSIVLMIQRIMNVRYLELLLTQGKLCPESNEESFVRRFSKIRKKLRQKILHNFEMWVFFSFINESLLQTSFQMYAYD